MILQDLLEDTEIQEAGAKYYPDLSNLDSYFLVRRHGTQEFIKAKRKIILDMPPIECMINPDIDARENEIIRRLISEYYVCGMVGFVDDDTGRELVYSKNVGVAIFHGDQGLHLVDGVMNTAHSHTNFMTRSRNKKLSNIKAYIESEFHCSTTEDKSDDLLLNHNNSTESYNNAKVKIDDSEIEIVSAFYDSCKYRKENDFLTSEQINEAYELHVTMTNHYDFVEIIKSLDHFYINLKIQREREQAEARKHDN